MKINDLFEARKNFDHPNQPSRDLYQHLSKYFDKDNIFLSFQDVNKIGINPRPSHGTPVGFYAYPLISFEQKLKQFKQKDQEINSVFPYGEYRQYIKVFTTTSEPLNIMDYNSFEEDKQKLVSMFNEEIINNCIRHDKAKQGQFAQIYDLTYRLTLMYSGGKEMHFVWNKLLRKVGLNDLVDYGNGIIHGMERAQALFLTTKNIKPLETIENFNRGKLPAYFG